MQDYKEIKIIKIKDDKINLSVDNIISEYPFTIIFNGEEFITILCSPNSLEYLTVGFLVSEGLIKNKEDIKSIRIDEENGISNIETYRKDILAKSLFGRRIMTTGCGRGSIFYSAIDPLKTNKKYNDFIVSSQYIFSIAKELNKKSELYIKTRGVHSCILSSKDKVLLFQEDIGRHNAVDKIIGEAFMKDINLEDKMIFASGRISSEMLLKSAKAGIPIVISRAAPTDLAVNIARKLGITLVGFVRGEKMNIYANEKRIQIDVF